jgi:hypothetical protein
MPGIGAALGNFLGKAGQRIGPELEQAAVQQAGAQIGASIGSKVTNAPHQLRERLASAESFATSPSSFGSTPLDNWFPEFRHSIFVAVSGGPQARLKDIWHLAVATAFGRFRQRIATFNGASVDCIWDVTDKSVGIRITYGSNGLIAAALGHIGINGESAVEVIQRGPSSETIGAGWAGFLQTIPQLLNRGGAAKAIGGRITPNTTGSLEEPTTPGNYKREGALERVGVEGPGILQDDGRLITTALKINPDVQPPRPPADFNLVALLSNSLTDPCYLPCKPPDAGFQVEEPQSYYFYEPGTHNEIGREFIEQAEQLVTEFLDLFPELGVDGVPIATNATAPVVPNECNANVADLVANPDNLIGG